MAKYCKKKKIKFILVCIDAVYTSKVIEANKSRDSTFNKDFFDNDLKNFSSSIDIEYLGLHKPFKEFYEKEGKIKETTSNRSFFINEPKG